MPSNQSSFLIIVSILTAKLNNLFRVLNINRDDKYGPLNQIRIFLTVDIQHVTKDKSVLAISSITVFCTLCLPKHKDKSKNLKTITQKEFKVSSLQYHDIGKFPGREDMMLWIIFSYGDSPGFIEELKNCNPVSQKTRPQYMFQVLDSNDGSARGQIYFWLSIMKNYSYIIEPICVNGKSMELSQFPYSLSHASIILGALTLGVAPYQYTLSFANHINSFQFITCGNRGFSMLPFIELVAVYKQLVWESLVVTLICFIMFLKFVWKYKTLDIFTNICKLVLEQGDPFPAKFFTNSFCRIMFGTLGLSALVLDNGYKNDNVNRIVAPRIQATYDKLSDLMQEGFSLYSRSGIASFSVVFMEFLLKFKFHPKVVHIEDTAVFFHSELLSLTSAVHTKLDSLVF